VTGTPKVNALSNTVQIVHPSGRFVFVEENDLRMDAIVFGYTMWENEGTWEIPDGSGELTPPNWLNGHLYDAPGLFHDNSTTFAFADGHAELHRWQDANFIWFSSTPSGDREGIDTSINTCPNDTPWICNAYPTTAWP